jgi:hypothetical protein
MLYASDFNIIAQLKLTSTIVQTTFSPAITLAQNASYFSKTIDKGV